MNSFFFFSKNCRWEWSTVPYRECFWFCITSLNYNLCHTSKNATLLYRRTLKHINMNWLQKDRIWKAIVWSLTWKCLNFYN
jgi:hypothetical protein